jgi:hypothetical protein
MEAKTQNDTIETDRDRKVITDAGDWTLAAMAASGYLN